MSVARRLAVAFAVVGLGVLAYAVPASATESQNSAGCITNPTPDQLVGTLDPALGVATVHAKPGVDVCGDVWLSSYTVPDSWVGPYFNSTAVPQALFDSKSGYVAGRKTTALSIKVPTCGAVQIDLYTPPQITAVKDTTGHDGHLLLGFIWRWYKAGQPVLCGAPTTPTPTPTTSTPTPTQSTGSPAPVPSDSSSPAPTPSESSSPVPVPSKSSSTPTPTPSGSIGTPTPAPTTPLGVIIVVPPKGVTPGPIVAVPTTPATPTTPVLASTGSNATIPLIGFGGALLVAGAALSVLGRRRKTA